MLLARASHERLERFFRQYFKDETLSLPRVSVYAGRFAGVSTTAIGFGAITFGSRVLIARSIVRRGEDGLLRAPGALVAHEATHVLQYERAGYVRFLFRYLREYSAALKKGSGRGLQRHWPAYRAISFEAEARAAEEAYAAWARESEARDAPS